MKKTMKVFLGFSIIGKISAIVIIVVIILGIFSDVLTDYPYDAPSGKALETPSADHWLGTDDLGIDLWAQICHGAKVSILVGFCAAFFAGIGGGIIGIISGYADGIIDKIMMRITDMVIVLPELALIIVIGAFFGPSLKNIIIVLALFSWTEPARIIRSKVIAVKQEKFIIASKSYGAGIFHLIRKHFLPVVFPLVMVSIVKLISRAIITEASLAFLGLGDPTSKSWGLILNHAINFKGIYYTEFWKWWVMSPLIAIFSIVIAVSFLYRELERTLLHKNI